MLIVRGRANSTNVKKVIWCAEEAGVGYERIDAGGVYGGLDTAAFGQLNPNRQVPVIEDGSLVLWESNAIVRYIAARYAAGTLSADDPGARALADRWMDWSATNFVPAFGIVFWTLIRMPPDQRDMAAVAAGIEKTAAWLAILDAELAERPYLSGVAFGMGDIPMGTLIHSWFNVPIERPDLPNVRRWYDRLLERAPYVRLVATPLT